MSHVTDANIEKLQAITQKLSSVSQSLNELRDDVNFVRDASLELKDALSEDSEPSLDPTVPPRGALKAYLQSVITHSLSESNDDLWRGPSLLSESEIPRFISVPERTALNSKTRFITFLNFKGGTGKSTISSNISAAFASGNYKKSPRGSYEAPLRVLIVDLDSQGSLSDRCLSTPDEFLKFVNQGVFASMLTQPRGSNDKLENKIFPLIGSETAKVLPTDPRLDVLDNQCLFHQTFKLSETRYNFRLWLHQPELLAKFDLVVFDCPPRKTASTINALTASDHVFIPASPDLINVQAVTRTINWLIKLIDTLKLPLKIGGVIFNRTNMENRLSEQELSYQKKIDYIINRMFFSQKITPPIQNYLSAHGVPEILSTHIPRRTGNSPILGVQGKPLPGSDRSLQFFTNLATEIYHRIYQ